jgi:hypothetical protein
MTPPTIKSIRIDDERLVFELGGGREVSLPVSVSDRLASATAAELQNWTIGSRGLGAHWPDVDEDIAIWEVLGIAEDAYLRSLGVAPVS